MARGRIGWLAVVVSVLGVEAARGQYPPPMPAGQPLPVATASHFAPPLSMQPQPSGMPPMGGSPSFGPPMGGPPIPDKTPPCLPDGLNAWNDDGHCDHLEGCFFHGGSMALWRDRLTSQPLVVLDPRNADANILPPSNVPLLLDASDLKPRANWGVRGALGYRCDCYAVELTGFYMFNNGTEQLVGRQNRLDLPFAVFPPPAGFGGNNNLWLNADRVNLTLESSMGNAEINYRVASAPGFEWIMGVRYLDYKESFSVLTDDDFNTAPGRFVADYRVETRSRILAPQLGFEWGVSIVPGVALGIVGKGAWGANFLDNNAQLIRGDGVAVGGTHSATIFSHLYEAGAFADLLCFERVRVRFGYQCLLLVNVPEASEQIDFNVLGNPGGRQDDRGFIFFHGPSVELQIQF